MSARVREVANPSLDAQQYFAMLKEWRSSFGQSWPGIEDFTKYSKCSSYRQVVPRAISQIHGLLMLLLCRGASNGVLFPAKWESAVNFFCNLEAVCARPGHRAVVAADFALHIQNCLGFVRIYKQEDGKVEAACSRRYPKSGSYRKVMSFADGELIRGLIVHVALSCSVSDDSLAEQPTSSSAANEVSAPQAFKCVPLDADGWPLCFQPGWGGLPSNVSSCAPSEVSIASTQLYDEDGFPLSDAGAQVEAVTPLRKSAAIAEAPVIDPKPKRRKAQAQSNRQGAPGCGALEHGLADKATPEKAAAAVAAALSCCCCC